MYVAQLLIPLSYRQRRKFLESAQLLGAKSASTYRLKALERVNRESSGISPRIAVSLSVVKDVAVQGSLGSVLFSTAG